MTVPDDVGEGEGHFSPEDPSLFGIAGWLIMPAIGFAVGPIVGVVYLIISVASFSDVEAGDRGGYALQVVVAATLLAFMIYAATRFFGRKYNAPIVIITYLVANLAVSLLFLVTGVDDARQAGKQLLRDFITAIIWIPCFLASKRVRTTFVN